jgi:N-acetylglucosamine-6-phosphate deacetylase
MKTALINHQLFDGENWHQDQAVVLANGLIDEIVPSNALSSDISVIDLNRQTLAPGFIDIQVNGGGGVLFNDMPTMDGLRTIAKAHRQYGTTGMMPTLITDDLDTMASCANAVRSLVNDPREGILGIHFEGPYLNPKRKGVHDERRIRPVEEEGLDLYFAKDLGVVIVTAAPETVTPGTIKRLADADIKICAGHSAATFEQIDDALGEGLRGFTHLFNAMSPMESRAPGVVGAALASADTWCGIIVDGHHVHPGSVQVSISAKPRGKMVLITDAMPSVGADNKNFTLQGRAVTVADGRCITDDGTLAGSDLDMISAVRNTTQMTNCDLGEALRMASLYPAEFLELEDKLGRIRSGYRADLVAFDEDFRVNQTWVAGSPSTH